jgi:hypothetical protein
MEGNMNKSLVFLWLILLTAIMSACSDYADDCRFIENCDCSRVNIPSHQCKIEKLRCALTKFIWKDINTNSGEGNNSDIENVSTQSTNRSNAVDTSKYISTDGITIPNNASGMPEGKFLISPFSGQMTRISLKGETLNANLDTSGEGSFSSDGKLAQGTLKFKPIRIMTTNNNKTWLNIKKYSIDENCFLIVTTEQMSIFDKAGVSYRIKFGSSFNGAIEEVTM